jgi:NADH:ubiquinone oxidoreductase subunit
MSLGTRLYTFFNGELVGTDAQGNRYYQERRIPRDRPRARWVMYNGPIEASRVPPEWHAWLHRTVDTPPVGEKRPKKPWQKEHLPNRTGTREAYRPPGSEYAGGRRPRGTGDYEPWRPS